MLDLPETSIGIRGKALTLLVGVVAGAIISNFVSRDFRYHSGIGGILIGAGMLHFARKGNDHINLFEPDRDLRRAANQFKQTFLTAVGLFLISGGTGLAGWEFISSGGIKNLLSHSNMSEIHASSSTFLAQFSASNIIGGR